MSEEEKPKPPQRPQAGQMGGPPRMSLPGEKPKDFKGTLRRLLAYLKPYRMQLLVVLIAAVLSTLFSIVAPRIMGMATDELFNSVTGGTAINFRYIIDLLMILAGLYLFSSLFAYFQQYFMSGVAQNTVYEMRKDVKSKLSRLPLRYYDRQSHGEVLSRVTNDVDNISNTLQQSLTQLITSIVTLVGVIIMMLTISPLLTLITILTIPLSLLVTIVVAKRSQKHFAGQQASLGDLNGHVEEMYTGHRVVKAFGREKQSLAQFDELNEKLYESGWKAQYISGTIMPLMSFISNIGYVLICVIGGIMVTRGTVGIGGVQAFIQYARQFSQPITQLANISNIIQSTIASAERVFEIMDEQEEEDQATATIARPVRGHVTFEHVAFGYKKDELLIEDMNIEVRAGQTVAIVGPTGAGKTTLINLLMRFYELNNGQITIDGQNIRELSRAELHSLFGMVLQDTWLFGGSIRDNIAYGREDATEEEIIRASEAARADHFIRTLPDGYDTVLNEEASNISQGQKQLLTIARAILADPAILILDEATSSVDTRTEVLIQQAMNTLMEGRTNFVIAHRLSTIREADLILVMNHGKVIETGTHLELLEQEGFYADLYNSQFTGQVKIAN
ncbi:putative ABC transporter ATP-binding protein YknV [Paenibacillus nuruki]|uniref:Putative ABC transporter ATP-binding protein YknV n=1 Tax=Paenibacillus nuruki TaxID=1886670 RepID=A0A1E3L355_9BACL|nr:MULTISPECIES: ABC transporter ATP-binding protein [Paenibacillus]ODP28242.1 putative ABC transporter ATP-binding protein YknV [Paenibacillus nuruki]TKJ91113.1 ABC transporter ATP-binding protein [Paenibacillus sp. CFBP13512]CAJ1317647.1 ABC transporter ATP-binding protein [Paenibacillus nuruki]